MGGRVATSLRPPERRRRRLQVIGRQRVAVPALYVLEPQLDVPLAGLAKSEDTRRTEP